MKQTLSDLCIKIGSGATPRGGKESYKAFGIPIIRSQNVRDYFFSVDGLAYIDEIQAAQLDNVIMQSGDVLINITGDSVARACMAPDGYLPARVNQHVAIIRANPQKADCHYILYFLQKQKEHLLSIASSGGTRNALTKKMLEDLVIDLPPLFVQREIAGILSAIDARIANNKAINHHLEQMAQAIFKSWFVDFEPFDGKQPVSWTIGTVNDISVDVVCGKTPSTKISEYFGEDIPFITIPDMHGVVYVTSTERSLSTAGASSQSSKTVPANSICVSCIATAGLVALTSVPSQTNQQINTIVCKHEISPYFVYLTMVGMADHIKMLGSSGSATNNLNKGQFTKIELMVPDSSNMSGFDALVEPLFEVIKRNQQENILLAETRDSLLPRLMSGELSIDKKIA